MSQNQFRYYNRSEPLFEVTFVWEILVDSEAILSSPVIYYVDKELLQKLLNLNYSDKDKFTKWGIQLWELYQPIKNNYIL
jgi:hypothetical protein